MVILAACNSNKQAPEPAVPEAPRRVEGPSVELAAIDSLLWRQPDSALACLLPYFDTCCRDAARQVSTVYNRHYAHLLLAELLYKNDYAQTNRAELLDAVGYFDSLTFTLNDHSSLRRLIGGGAPLSPTRNDRLFFLSARAHYINGVGYYEHDSVVEACKEYLKALEVMEEHFEEKELEGKKAKFMALTHSHLTSLFTDMYLHEQAIYFCKESLKYYRKHNAEPWHIAWILSHIGSSYQVLGDYDSAYYYYNEGLKTLPDANCLTYRDISTLLANLSYENGACQEYSLNQLHNLLTQAESHQEYASRCLNIGEIYYHEQQFDSAWHYLYIVFEHILSTDSKKQAAKWLAEIAETQERKTEAVKYARFLVPFANMEENQSAIKSQLIEQYKNHVQKSLEREHQREKMESQRWAIVTVVSLLILMLFIVILYHRNKKRKQYLETQIEADRYAFEMQQKALSGKLKKSKKALHDALEQIDNHMTSMNTQSKTELAKDYFSFVQTPICEHILGTVHQQNFKSKIDYLVYREHALQKEQLLALRVAADENMNDFTVRLRKRFPNLTDEDVTYCCLYLLDISDADIAALMQKAYPTVCERKRKIKRIVGEENNLSFALRNLS